MFRLAAEQGDAEAQCGLGEMYYGGEGVPQDYAEAIKWWKISAEQGHEGAQNNLGLMYIRGKGVTQDYEKSAKWFRLAAEQGNVNAQWYLGNMQRDGVGVIQDYKEAVSWFRKAAEQGHAFSQYELGNAYRLGDGLSKDIQDYLKSNPEPSTGPGYMIYEGIGDYIKKDFPKFNINEVVTSNQKTINGLTPTLKTDKIFNSKTFFDSEKRQEEVLVLDNTKKIN